MAYVEIDRNYQVRAAVVFPNVLADSVSVTPETRLEEAVGLARAINLDVAYREIVKLREIKPSAYFSRGFVDRVKPLFETEEIELMIVDASLTPIQQRNLEKRLKSKSSTVLRLSWKSLANALKPKKEGFRWNWRI